MDPAPTTPPEDKSSCSDTDIPKLQKALNRVTNLTDRLSNSGYSSKYINLSSTCNTPIDAKTNFLFRLTISLLLFGFHLSLNDLNFISYKVLWMIICLPLLYLFCSGKSSALNRKLALFYLIRLASSSIVYSLVYKVSLPYQFHIKSHEYDILASSLCFTLGVIIFPAEAFKVGFWRSLQLLVDLAISLGLQHYFKQGFDPFSYCSQMILFGFVSLVCHLVTRKADQDKSALELGVLKHCQEISQELKEIHDSLKEEEAQPTPVKAQTSSVADEILTKVKYLKFKLMQEEKERRFLNTKNSVFGPNKRSLMKGFSTLALTSKADKRLLDSFALVQRRGSFKNQDRSPPGEEDQAQNDNNNDEGLLGKWHISAKDCDSLIKMISEKHTNMYYPEVLTETNNQINTETAEFLKQHFTDIGNNLLSSEFKFQRSNSLVNDSKAFASSPWNDYLETNACTWNFDMLKFKDLTNGRHIPEFGSFMFKKFNILKTLHTSPNTVVNFLKDVSEGYLPNPYHNSIHGADVANSIAYFLNNQDFRDNFNDLESSCLLIAALVHDLGHPGFNNAFLVATKSTEALLYNDQSVLENLHTAYYYKILQKPSSNILQGLTEMDQKFFRKLSIGLILDTDLTKHFVILTKFKGIADQINLEQEENRFLSLSIALKCADVGHGAKELTLHKKWSRRIIEEFYLQGDKERQYGIPVSPLCDRAGKVSNSQQGFLNFIVLPLFEAFDKKFFNDKMREDVTDQVMKNLEYWKEEIPKEERGECKFKEETQKTLEDIQSELPVVN